ncbi:MAG: hypothetical protein U9Q96_00755 [Patescibacteria group bacterium]|nr:hypothetical protein [Patescibacteria group bacterium]
MRQGWMALLAVFGAALLGLGVYFFAIGGYTTGFFSIICTCGFGIFWFGVYHYAWGTQITSLPPQGIVYEVVWLPDEDESGSFRRLLLQKLCCGPILYFCIESRLVPKGLQKGDKILCVNDMLRAFVSKE